MKSQLNEKLRNEIEQVLYAAIEDLNPGVGDDGLVEVIESGDCHELAIEEINKVLKQDFEQDSNYKIAFDDQMGNPINQLDKLTIKEI